MNTESQELIRIANSDSIHGCLSHLRTNTSRRRHLSDEDLLTGPNPFISDRAKILESKTFRLLGQKTQVFTFPKTPLVRNRLSHVLEVEANCIKIASILGLNTDLVSAASLCHDVGHVPFGHPGEHWMAEAMGRPDFCHEVMGVVVTQHIERRGKGLNLTFHTLDAGMRHSGNLAREEMSQEAWVLRYADKITYLVHDITDILVRMLYPESNELSSIVLDLGRTPRERTASLIAGLLVESRQMGKVSFSESPMAKRFNRLRTLMYEIYPRVTMQNVKEKMGPVLEALQNLKIGNPFLLLALMTDVDVDRMYSAPTRDMNAFNQTSIHEIVPYLDEIGQVDMFDPDLNW